MKREIKNMREWEKWNKNPKYCEHTHGYWSPINSTMLKCVTCGKDCRKDWPLKN